MHLYLSNSHFRAADILFGLVASAIFVALALGFGGNLHADDDADWLKQETKRQVEGCRIKSDSGIWLHTPDGVGHYKALWTRDYYYFVKYAGDFIDDANLKASIQYVLDGQRADGCIPDRVNADGTPIYSPGGDKKPLADHALDNAPFLALLACEYVRRTGDHAFFRKIEPRLRKGLDHVSRADNGLVYNSPDKPQCVYGFTDIVTKTGHLLFTSLLYYQACIELDEVQKVMGGERSFDYRSRAESIANNISILWDDESGMYLAADMDCRQIDIWGSAYAAEVGLATDAQTDRIAEYMLAHWEEIVLHGQVRHLPGTQGWQRLFIDRHPPGSYINGAHWATPLPWVVPVIARNSPERARQMLNDVIADFKANGVAECINNEKRKVPNFVASVTNLYGASQWLANVSLQSENNQPCKLYTYSFGGIEDMDVDDAVEMLDRLGYAGIAVEARGEKSLDRLDQYYKFSERKGEDFKIVAAFMAHRFDKYGFSDTAHKAAIDRLAGKAGTIWIWARDTVQDGSITDAMVEKFLVGIAEYAIEKGVKVVIYPHHNTYYPTVENCLPLVEKIDHPSVGIAISLCHELKSGKGANLERTFKMAKHRISAIIISGALDKFDQSNANTLNASTIRSLEQSTYDLRPFMRLIKSSGFEGPVGFINFKLPEKPEVYLEKTMTRWKELCVEVGLIEPKK